MALTYGDFETFIHDMDGRIFRYWVYRRMFTPAETEHKYIDQGFYEDSTCSFGLIKECVALADKDYLIGFQDVDVDDMTVRLYPHISYFKLSEIRMGFSYMDQISDDKELIEE